MLVACGVDITQSLSPCLSKTFFNVRLGTRNEPATSNQLDGSGLFHWRKFAMKFARVVGRRTLASVLSAALPAAALLNGAELPIKQVTLYKHGIGFFERDGSVPAGDEARLDFRNTDMNDILKSLTVNDSSGKRVLGIRYDSNESLQQRLEKYPFALKQDELLSSFLDHL